MQTGPQHLEEEWLQETVFSELLLGAASVCWDASALLILLHGASESHQLLS